MESITQKVKQNKRYLPHERTTKINAVIILILQTFPLHNLLPMNWKSFTIFNVNTNHGK